MPKAMKPEDTIRRVHAARERAMRAAMRRKEEYLGARVPRALKERVIARAAEEGIPVSLLIRQVLEDAFPESGASVAPPADAPVGPVLAWQAVELAAKGECVRCGTGHPAGTQMWYGLGGEPSPYLVCDGCKEALTAPVR